MPPVDEAYSGVRFHLESLIQEEFFNRKVYNLVDGRISDKVQKLTERYMDRALPGLVAVQLLEQVPKFLDQNAVMRDILDKHRLALTNDLNKASREILQKISKESQYHDVRQAYVRAIDEKFAKQMTSLNALFAENMKVRMEIIDKADERIKSLETWNKVTSMAVLGLGCGLISILWKKN